jgi:lipoprotein-anchoring transpeptidase ErfK/SrfK
VVVMGWSPTHRRLAAIGLIVAMLSALAAAAPESAASGPGSAQRAASVREVQAKLAALKFMPTSQIDGRLGPRTKDAITAFQQWHGLTPDGIAGPRTLAKLSNAAAPRPGSKGPSRRIEVFRAKGITLLIDNGSVTRVIHSNAGKRGFETPAGSYQIVRKVLRDWSRPYKTWMPYASYFHGGYALHEGSVPTYSASHGCVRMTSWDAPDAYRFATVGTAVVVY